MLRLLIVGTLLAGGAAMAVELSPSAKDLAELEKNFTERERQALERAAELSVTDQEGRAADRVDVTATETSTTETITVKKRHGVVAANTLWDMAKFYYEDPFQWPVIFEANKHRIKDPHWIYPGQTFIIPGLDKMVTVVKEIPVAQPVPVAVPEPEPELRDEEEPEPEPVHYQPDEGEGIVIPDDLSVYMPSGMAGQRPSMYRMKMPDSWRADGVVVKFRGRESMVAAGDVIRVRIKSDQSVRKRQRYSVYRKASATESDVDQKAKYMQKIGLIEIIKRTKKKNEYRARVLKSGGSIMLKDQLKRTD